MREKECGHYTDSIVYALEQTSIYCRVRGAQLFNNLNLPVTLEQFIALDAIFCNPDICQRDLSKLILKDRSNTGRILTILEKNGFVERVVETKAKRLVRKIYITQLGKKIIEENQDDIRKGFSRVFDDISEEEFAVLRKTLAKMKESLSTYTTLQI